MIYDTFLRALAADPEPTHVWYEHRCTGPAWWRVERTIHGVCISRPLVWWERILLAFGGRP